MISRRVADNRLGFVKDDLLFALRRIQIDLDTYEASSTEPAPLETMLDALEQVRGPLAALEHREAVALLDEMHAVILDRVSGALQSLDLPVLQQATDRIASYLEACLSPGSRRPDAELVETVETLRRAHLRAKPTGSGAQTQHQPEAAPAIHTLQDTLKQIQQTIAGPLEQAADQPESWQELRTDLLDLRRLLADHDWATLVFDRLDRIVAVLADGAAEYYGTLVTGVCADILAGLGYNLEPLSSSDSAPATVLKAAQEHLSQLETLLHLPALTQIPTATSTPPVKSVVPAALEVELLPLEAPAVSLLEATSPNLDANMSKDVAGLVELIGLTDADPEFIEVFLEEACGELAVIREQLALWRQHLGNEESLTTLRRCFHTLKGSGRMVGATVIGDFAWEFENLLNQVIGGGLPPSPEIAAAVEAAADALAPLVGEIAPRENALKALAPLAAQAQALLLRIEPKVAAAPLARWAIAPDIDPEFAEVFLEEARGELAAIREQLAFWRQHLENREALTTLRRAFHTLKGSGRVVGATVVGDFAWQFESLLSQVLNGTLPATPALAELIDAATTALEPLVSETPATTETALAPLALLSAQVEQLLREPPIEIEAAPAAPKPAAYAEIAPPPQPVVKVEPAPAPTLERMPAPTVETSAMLDADMAQIFQYEATEILDASDAILQQLGVNPDRPELLNDLRRGMHTLKGSSRMAGIMTIGDLAHAAESVLDALGKIGGKITPIVLDSLQHTLDRLNQMLAEAASGTRPVTATDLIADLHRLADLVAAGEEVTEELPPAALADLLKSTPTPAAMVAEPSSFRTMTELDQELAQVFQTEATEILDSSDIILQRLRGELDNVELLNNLRREMHTLKGSSRMAGFMMVGDLAHAAESVLDALSKGLVKAAPSILDPVQRALDSLHQMLAGVVSGARPQPQPALIDELHGLVGARPAERPRPVAPAAPVMVPTTSTTRIAEKNVAAAPTDSIRVSAVLLNTLVNQMGESSIFRARIDQGVGAMSLNLNELEQTITRLRRQVTHLATQAEARIQSRQDQGAKAHQLEFDPLELDRFTELQQVARSLMEIADDLGNVGNTLGDHSREITTLLDHQGKVNKEIQQGLMRTGMVRFGSIIPRLRRVVRQASQDLGKRAELLVGGEESEVDRTVLENMVAPLEHMLRNSLAHGIETPEQRRVAGKSDIGTIALSLRREGAELVLELGDDGNGLNFDAIRAKGEEKGLLLPGQPATPEELIALLLRPGFSTATAVTQISGRGVGMDVVNEAIRAMRGALLIQTDPGQGTRFIVRLPFSLSVTQALLVRAGEATYAIPLLSIELVTRIKEPEFQAYLAGEHIQHQYSDRHYPLHNLGILMGSDHILPFEEVSDRRPPTLLFRSAEASAALQVEAVLGNQEIIVKPVGPQFNAVSGISGATVLGDGRVVVVLELAALVRNIGSQAQKQAESRALRAARQEARPEKISIMVVDDSITMRKVTARILERHSIQSITAKDGLDAVAMLQTQVPDLTILDIEMPRMDGFEVVAHVRNQPHLRHMPIIMVTSRGGEKHRERAFKLGVNDYLTKPYQEEQLMQSIRKILGERALGLIT
jgi:chemosensory pili system protein ChpA (sensor histidine kinase/response regulator)